MNPGNGPFQRIENIQRQRFIRLSQLKPRTLRANKAQRLLIYYAGVKEGAI